MAIAAGAVLGLACLFLFYVLLEFHWEAGRLRKGAPQPDTRVIAFRRKLISHVSRDPDGPKTKSDKANICEMSAPMEFRRLARKRVARS